jgi:hypothetical protein
MINITYKHKSYGRFLIEGCFDNEFDFSISGNTGQRPAVNFKAYMNGSNAGRNIPTPQNYRDKLFRDIEILSIIND